MECTKKDAQKQVMNCPVLLEILISRRNIPPGIDVAGPPARFRLE
jgi:hypothetical protein